MALGALAVEAAGLLSDLAACEERYKWSQLTATQQAQHPQQHHQIATATAPLQTSLRSPPSLPLLQWGSDLAIVRGVVIRGRDGCWGVSAPSITARPQNIQSVRYAALANLEIVTSTVSNGGCEACAWATGPTVESSVALPPRELDLHYQWMCGAEMVASKSSHVGQQLPLVRRRRRPREGSAAEVEPEMSPPNRSNRRPIGRGPCLLLRETTASVSQAGSGEGSKADEAGRKDGETLVARPAPQLHCLVWNATGCVLSTEAQVRLLSNQQRRAMVGGDLVNRFFFGLGVAAGVAVVSKYSEAVALPKLGLALLRFFCS